MFRYFYNIIFKFHILVCLLFILSAFLSMLSRELFSYLHFFCHQIPEKCFFIFNNQIGLCARCLGIYIGFFIYGIILLVSSRYSLIVLLISLSISLHSFLLKILSIELINLERFISGIFIGIFLSLVIYYIIDSIKKILMKILLRSDQILSRIFL